MPVPPEAAAAPPRSGVIHNIGYRNYTGPRLGRGYATRSLLVHSLRGAYGLGRSAKSKVLPMVLLAAMCLPALILVALAVSLDRDELPVDPAAYVSNTSTLLGLFLAAQAPVALSRDLRFMTVPLYFSRPLTRTDYVRAKFGAMTAALLVLTALPVVILYAGALLAGMDVGHNTAQALYGLGTALLYSVLYAAIGLLVAATTPRRGFGVAAIIGVLIVSTSVAGIAWALFHSSGHAAAANWAGLLSPSTLVDSLSTWLFRLPHSAGPSWPPSTGAGVVFLAEFAVITAAAYALLLRRYRKF
ncbi:ABC transporter permease [Peterkaempfera bronchialis]|uniref:ABC transporter permease n=1 Tax=Peterkaempfera bronchialis TaxID=2126346 RepID=A0A345SY91_9ACTN|nr:ABC transporter permease [Peterkaempfera bronchialis]AXI78696.1 ABC transporter permease [Peterkaempfera bronchialis]